MGSRALDEQYEKYRMAGRIASRIKDLLRNSVEEGSLALEICEKVEGWIVELGGRPAFPCNIGINEVAAHFTPGPDDETRIPEGSIVKLDFGVHVDGYISDNAVTYVFNPKYEHLRIAAEEALHSATDAIRAGLRASEIGAIIEREIIRYGCKPVRDLTGHRMDRYTIHAGKSLPNVPTINGSRILEGEVYAIEPFTTISSGAGTVIGRGGQIYRLVKEKGVRDRRAEEVLDFIRREYKGLPFAQRWILGTRFPMDYIEAWRELEKKRCIAPYPVLVEASGSPVAQSEHTVIVLKDGCEVLT
ncbi:MAG: type II methionyl aminopeptidase [Candidatus Bathyarchaeia archaeon]